MRIPRAALIVVADGRKALFLSNRGDAKFPSLHVESTMESDPNPPTHDQGTERPGRVVSSVGHHRSAVEGTDWHQRMEAEFARKVAAAMTKLLPGSPSDHLIVVAPPHMLAELRKAFGASVSKAIKAEIDKDLTKHPVGEIQALLIAA